MTFAAIFPGQGSQSVGMLSELAQQYPLVQQTFAEASDALGFDLWDMVQNGPDTDLNSTHNTQPAMLSAGVAVWRIWNESGAPQPAAMAGHSLGEFTALVCSGAMGFSDAVKLVAERGRLMQEAVPEGQGAMAAILGLEDAVVISVCEKSAEGDVVQAVNFNSPGQVVIAGSASAVDRAIQVATDEGAKKAIKLPVSVPSHCDLMKPAAEKLAERLTQIEIATPSIPVIHNVDVTSHSDADAIRNALSMQLYRPVRWVETVQKLVEDGMTDMVEMGPGKVLMGLIRRIDRSVTCTPVQDPAGLDKALGKIKGAE